MTSSNEDSSSKRSCCSFQHGLSPIEHRKWRRVHGLQFPLHPQQVGGWVALFLFGFGSFFVLIPSLGPSLQPFNMALLGCLFAVHIVSHLTALLLDPADRQLRLINPRSKAVPEFDRSKHAHVIENGRCHLCNIKVSSPRTKHCAICNKCVERFDHHCKWLNHCIGGRNYTAFIVCVVSAVLATLAIGFLSILELIFYNVDPAWLSAWTEQSIFNTTLNTSAYFQKPLPIDDNLFLIVIVGLCILAAVSAGLLSHLCLFHIYIAFLKVTTYEYIRNYRQLSTKTTAPPNSESAHTLTSLQPSINNSDKSTSAFWHKSKSRLNCPSYISNPLNCKKLKNNEGNTGVDVENGKYRRTSSTSSMSNKGTFDKEFSVESIDTIYNSSESENFVKAASKPPVKRMFLASPNISTSRKNSFQKTCQGCRYCKVISRHRRTSNYNKNQLKFLKRQRGVQKRVYIKLLPKFCYNNDSVVLSSPSFRNNQIKPSIPRNMMKTSSSDDILWKPKDRLSTPLPTLPPPARRQIQSVSLKELGDVLAFVQTPQIKRPLNPARKQLRKKVNSQCRPTKSPSLSPIHESGLSNPSTPQLKDRLLKTLPSNSFPA
nr:PREDICTED: uncharacterized protein LOC109031626 [Bemisia tabaci]